MQEIITLDVGGVLFKTTKTTLMKASYFSSQFERWDNNKPYFIDRDGEAFGHVLRFLRDTNYKVHSKYRSELDFYGVKYCKDDIENDKEMRNIADVLYKIYDSITDDNGALSLKIDHPNISEYIKIKRAC